MRCRSITKAVVLFVIVLCSICRERAFCQSDFEKALEKKVDSLLAPIKTDSRDGQLVPDDAPQSLTIPSGWGGYGSYVFGSIGGVYPQTYQKKADLIASGGFCTGNPITGINFAAGINMADVHRLQDFSANFIISRVVSAGSSISAGGLQLFASQQYSDASGSTFYFAFSHAVQTLPSKTPGTSRLNYTIGIGSGRFYIKSADDVKSGRGRNGTALFGGVSYEIVHHVNLITEWSGMNLAVSAGLRPFKNALSVSMGIANLTRYSNDKRNFVFNFGYPLSLSRPARQQ
jgi:hypothetical protein